MASFEGAMSYEISDDRTRIDGEFSGFARVITDWATMYYVSDLFVVPSHRGCGLGEALTQWIVDHPRRAGCTGILKTADAHDLYSRAGFTRDEETGRRVMVRRPE
jgi:GNAT superfamily N-acetyltransferase